MRRVYLNYGAAVMQCAQLGIKLVKQGIKYVMPQRFRKKRGPTPYRYKAKLNGFAGGPLMICDRSSSFKKMRRRVNQGATPMLPDQRAVVRHKVRRIEIQRAKNRTAMEHGNG